MWTYDLAREQHANLDFLRRICKLSLDSGYDALGLYLEHRYAYECAPWAAAPGCMDKEMVRTLRKEFPSLRLIPFANFLGHMEGFLYTEEGKHLAEERFQGAQGCPSNPETLEFAKKGLKELAEAFDDEVLHIGGDETAQLARCSVCKEKEPKDLYLAYQNELLQYVKGLGKRPAIWGDMLLEHSSLIPSLPKDTLIFNWQYFHGFEESTPKFLEHGLEVVVCPTVMVYSATWCHRNHSLDNARWAKEMSDKVQGYCLTTWESAMLSNYETILPIVEAIGKYWKGGELAFEESYDYWAKKMDEDLQKIAPVFELTFHRSKLRSHLLLYSNPFQAWYHLGEALNDAVCEKVYALMDQASQVAPNPACRRVSESVRKMVEAVQHMNKSYEAYRNRKPGEAASALAPIRQIFEDLERIANATHLTIGGSIVDIERCKVAKKMVETVMLRIKHYGDGSLGYLPSYESIIQPQFIPHDQANWWLQNDWGLKW